MPAYEHDKDTPESVRERAEQDDPSVMYMVVRREKIVSLEALLIAGVQSVAGTVKHYTHDPNHTSAFELWYSRSFRKVCLRSNEKDWPRVCALDGVDGCVGGVSVVRTLPPRLRSAREKILTQLQAYNAETSKFLSEASSNVEEAATMVFVLNETLPMRAGKMLAQIGHAVLLAVDAFGEHDADALKAWSDAGFPCAVRRATESQWKSLKRDHNVAMVRDAGLTEVEPGSETFMALSPVVSSQWPASVRELKTL
jgi:peptidyl-tRNA hydrolase